MIAKNNKYSLTSLIMIKGFEPWIIKENKLAKIEEKQNLVFDLTIK